LAKKVLLGSMVTMDSPEVVEILTEIGFDWLFIDAEHSPFSGPSIQNLIRAAGTTPSLVRTASQDPSEIKNALDAGAAGIIVPQVNSKIEAEQIVSSAKYPPMGTRGVGISRAHGYGQRFQEYVDRANDETIVVIQVEHIDAVSQIEELASVKGVDAIFIGPYDLSASMNKMGQVDDPEVKKAISKVREICQQVGMPLGYFGVSATGIQTYIDQGFSLIVAGVDTLHLAKSAKAFLAELRNEDQ